MFLIRCPQWTDDEDVCARNVNNEIHFFEGGCPGTEAAYMPLPFLPLPFTTDSLLVVGN